MNWKVIVGLLLIFGGLKEFISIRIDHANGLIPDPMAAELGALTLVLVGGIVVYKFRIKKII
jgi:hypothetical protein